MCGFVRLSCQRKFELFNHNPLWCSTVGATVTVHQVFLYFTFLSHLFPLPCGAGSTVPREVLDLSAIMPFSWCVVAVTLPIKCRSTFSVKPPYIHFRFAGIHGGCG